jgi:gamma-glutamyltranspeptidase/glutathione hydrolase
VKIALPNLVVRLLILAFVGLQTSLANAVPSEGHHLMLAGPSPLAVTIAKDIHRAGGNLVDASVAVAMSLAVTHPYYGSLGGGGFALIKMDGKTQALDFRETAPASTNPETYAKLPLDASIDGGLAVGVPGVTAGLWELHKKFGKLKWAAVVKPAVQLAEKGFEVSGEWSLITNRNLKRFDAAGRTTFFRAGDVPYKAGDVLKQPKLAKLLKQIQSKGPDAFYKGAFAKELAATVKNAGGNVTAEDLANYKVRWMEPVTAQFNGYRLLLMPPPSSGGVVIAQAVRMLDLLDVKKYGALSVNELHYLAEIMKLSYRGRELLGDPDFHKNPIDTLTAETELKRLSAMIKPDKVLSVDSLKLSSKENPNTTHFSMMDDKGNAISLTVTLNGNYGSGLVVPSAGVPLNNEMDDFTTHPGKPNMFGLIQGEGNRVRAGARPLSSMSPTIVEKDGRTVMALGAPGGPRIISAVFQVLYRVLEQDFNVDEAVQAPRIHHQFLPDKLVVDKLKWAPESLDGLKARGHKIDFGSTGKVYAVERSEDGTLQGAADTRGESGAGGY